MKARIWFEAQGRSARSRGLSISHGRAIRVHWPEWARKAWAAGWVMQGEWYVWDAAPRTGRQDITAPVPQNLPLKTPEAQRVREALCKR